MDLNMIYKKLRRTTVDIQNLEKGLEKKKNEKARLEEEIKKFQDN